jgi:hypothetical protein
MACCQLRREPQVLGFEENLSEGNENESSAMTARAMISQSELNRGRTRALSSSRGLDFALN